MKINEKSLCVFASNTRYAYDGFLNKRGEINKSFQRRYFALKGNLLFYFEKKGEKHPLGLIIVEGCIIELLEESEPYCFQVAFRDNRTYILSTDSQKDLVGWMKALTCASYEYKMLIMTELQLQLQEFEITEEKILRRCGSSETFVSKPTLCRQNPFNRDAPPPVQITKPFNNISLSEQIGFTSDFNRDLQIGGTLNPAFFHNKTPLVRMNEPNEFRECCNSKLAFLPGQMETCISSSFEQLHEKYRQLIMKDVLNYQMEKSLMSQPLVKL